MLCPVRKPIKFKKNNKTSVHYKVLLFFLIKDVIMVLNLKTTKIMQY